MPPKTDIKTYVAKRNNAIDSLHDLFEEFAAIFDTEPEISTLENVFKQIEAKYRNVKKQQETISDKIVESGLQSDTEEYRENKEAGDRVKMDYLKICREFSAYKTKCVSSAQAPDQEQALKTMTVAVQKMADSLTKPGKSTQGIEKLSVPTWDGKRRTFMTWKHEFQHWMTKYAQDEDEQLQRFRKALPKHSWWAEQVKTCKNIKKAWQILDVEFADQRKLMDELLAEITSHKQVKSDSQSLLKYATTISMFVNDMEDNGFNVRDATEAPFFMSQLLSKMSTKDNADFGRDMLKEKKEEDVENLIEWLHREANLRSRGKQEQEHSERAARNPRHGQSAKRFEVSASTTNTASTEDERQCINGCTTNHPLHSCPVYCDQLTVDQRWQKVKRNKLCRKCLECHHTDDCKIPDGSSCTKCDKRHHTSLHNEKSQHQAKTNQSATKSTAQNSSIQENTKRNITGLCPVQKVMLKDRDGNHHEALAMLDSGSNTSFISKRMSSKLKITGSKSQLTLYLAGGKKTSEEAELVEVRVISPDDSSVEKTLQLFTISSPCSPAKTLSRKAVEEYPHLKEISDKLHLSGGKIDILFGTNFPEVFTDIHVITGSAGNEPIAKKNCFGWYALGQFVENTNDVPQINSIETEITDVLQEVKQLLYHDMIGVKPTRLCTCSDEILKENKFIKSIENSTQLINDRVQVKMPWKECGPPKESNYTIALQRMYRTEKNLLKNGSLEVIDAEVQNLLKQGFVIEVPNEEVNHKLAEWYLPMHPVYTPERSTKVRLVFDASFKGHDGLSLNDRLEKGPNYINDLPSVLMSWRWDNVAYCGDIRKMFNQILIHPDDQIYHRFLWRRNTADQPTTYQWVRLNFGDKPAPDIATNSIQVLAKASADEFTEAARELQDHSYVDDIGGSRSCVSTVKRLTNEIDEILSKGQFQIKEWHSNHKDADQTNERFTSFLGHKWDKQNDVISLKMNASSLKPHEFTKRKCLTSVARLWDPVGLLSPVTIKYRINLQDVWCEGFSWDDILPDEKQMEWLSNIEEMDDLLNMEFQRNLKPSDAVSLEVHGFCDGGELAYGAVIFLRWKLQDGSYKCTPVISKALVAPLKKKSTPRLELLGCLTLARIYSTFRDAFKYLGIDKSETKFWTDSTCVLGWIKSSPRRYKPFVSSRVAEIQESVDVTKFAHIESNSNPADALTRGIRADQLSEWRLGPSFLKCPEETWPTNHEPALEQPEADEIIKEVKMNVASSVTTQESILQHLTKNCSTFPKVKRTLAYVLRFVNNLKSKVRNVSALSSKELKDAEILLFKWDQVNIERHKLPKSLYPQVDKDGLLRAHGRLEDIRSLPEDTRCPIILPRNSPLSHLLLADLHRKKRHCGYQSLIHEARKNYWIIGLRSSAKFLTRKCVICRKLRKRLLEQQMGQLPSLRVAVGCSPFSNTALDMFGPLHIKLGRKTLKEAQAVIFTCMTTRAIHLELVTDKSSDTFLMAFRRFASIRGHPSICWSDCGTNFVGAQKYLQEIIDGWNTSEIEKSVLEEYNCEFKWKWNIPHASHQNGVVESLIKSVRQALDASCKCHTYSEEQWRTILTEITYMINNRPLYPSSNDIFEVPPITPNDILLGNHNQVPQPESPERVNPRDLIRSVEQRVKEFWTCWVKYFAPNLLPRNKWYKRRENVKEGDLVLEADSNKRSKWSMGLITEVLPGNDGLVRKVVMKTKTGSYKRPIHKLCLIATKEELENFND